MAAMTEQEFMAALSNMPTAKPVTYRLYHDDQGRPLHYTMEDMPGQWVEIDKDLFRRCPSRVRVRNGRVHEIQWRTTEKLVPGQIGTACHPKDVTIIHDGADSQHWSRLTHEPD